MASTARELLGPYLASDAVRPNGDMDMHCPVHEDARRSATVNFRTGEWYCHGCGFGGSIGSLLKKRSEWLPVPSHSSPSDTRSKTPLPDSARIDGWVSSLLSKPDLVDFLEVRRGITLDTIRTFGVGWDGRRYTLPIYDEDGDLVNVRRYRPDAEKAKMLNWQGWGSPPRLYPMGVLLDNPSEVVICEGEWDALITNQSGLPAVTSTGGVKTLKRWRANWTNWFSNRTVFLCFDRDRDGLNAIKKVKTILAEIVNDLIVVELPYPMGSGKDLTDYILDGKEVEKLRDYATADIEKSDKGARIVSYEDLRIGDIEGSAVQVEGTLASVFGTQVMLPDKLTGHCGVDWDPKKCSLCPLGHMNGDLSKTVSQNDEMHLELLTATTPKQRNQIFKEALGAPSRCPAVKIEPHYYSAWDCEIRNGSNLAEEAYPIVLRHEGKPPVLNHKYKFEGRLRVAPKGQRAIFMASSCEPAKQDIDSFYPLKEDIAKAREWSSSLPGDPDEQLEHIAEKLEYHTTEIYGQRLLHMGMELVFHSILQFRFGGSVLSRGWMECLAIGETRSGKSTAAQRLLELYGRGHYQSAENTSIAGMLFGVDKRAGSSREAWGGTIGVLPLNNRGLVAIDESQGLTKEQISQMSDMRSRGIVQISKIRAIEVEARVRLMWLGNGRKPQYGRGIEALADQMGQAEDLARVDIPIYIKGNIGKELDKSHKSWGPLPWSEDILRWILLWSWSRKAEQVKWSPASMKAIWALSKSLSRKFTTTVPIFQPNEAGVRLARMSAALAARLFASRDGKDLFIESKHVEAAARLYERFLGAQELGLTEVADYESIVKQAGRDHHSELRDWLRYTPIHIRQQIVAGSWNPSVDPGGAYITKLSSWHAVYLEGGEYRVAQWAIDIARRLR